jgi:hypothetical protein
MDLEALKIRTKEIRSQYVGKRYVSWPKDFKQEVVAAIDSGVATKDMADALGISFPTVFSWKRIFSPKKSSSKAFKPISIVDDQKPTVELSWKQGLTAKGISFSEFKELLKEGLL